MKRAGAREDEVSYRPVVGRVGEAPGADPTPPPLWKADVFARQGQAPEAHLSPVERPPTQGLKLRDRNARDLREFLQSAGTGAVDGGRRMPYSTAIIPGVIGLRQ